MDLGGWESGIVGLYIVVGALLRFEGALHRGLRQIGMLREVVVVALMVPRGRNEVVCSCLVILFGLRCRW